MTVGRGAPPPGFATLARGAGGPEAHPRGEVIEKHDLYKGGHEERRVAGEARELRHPPEAVGGGGRGQRLGARVRADNRGCSNAWRGASRSGSLPAAVFRAQQRQLVLTESNAAAGERVCVRVKGEEKSETQVSGWPRRLVRYRRSPQPRNDKQASCASSSLAASRAARLPRRRACEVRKLTLLSAGLGVAAFSVVGERSKCRDQAWRQGDGGHVATGGGRRSGEDSLFSNLSRVPLLTPRSVWSVRCMPSRACSKSRADRFCARRRAATMV